ncbi:hypothetical protein CDEN61S_02039 [Castellaniella denitrificans]
MLVKFSVDPDALQPSTHEISLLVSLHRRVLESWRDLGLLIHPGMKLNDSPLLKCIDELPVALRQLWKAAFKGNKRLPSNCLAWDGTFNNSQEPVQEIFSEIQLALLESARVTLLTNIDDDAHSGFFSSSRVEICRFHAMEDAVQIKAARSLRQLGVKAEANAAKAWNERYRDWLQVADNVVLVDRYCIEDYCRSASYKEKPGLARMLEGVRRRGRKAQANVLIYAAKPKEESDFKAWKDDLKNYCGEGIREITIYIATSETFGRLAHHRYMRCDYSIFGMDRGIGAFSGEKIRSDCILWHNDMAREPIFRDTEASLKPVSRMYKLDGVPER